MKANCKINREQTLSLKSDEERKRVGLKLKLSGASCHSDLSAKNEFVGKLKKNCVIFPCEISAKMTCAVNARGNIMKDKVIRSTVIKIYSCKNHRYHFVPEL